MCVCGCELERILSVSSTWTSSDRWQALKFLCAFHGNCKQTTQKSKKINKATTTTLSDADTHEMTAKKDQNMTIKIRTLKSDRLAGRPHPHPRPRSRLRPCPRTRLRFCFCLFFFFILFSIWLFISVFESESCACFNATSVTYNFENDKQQQEDNNNKATGHNNNLTRRMSPNGRHATWERVHCPALNTWNVKSEEGIWRRGMLTFSSSSHL